MRYSRVEFLRLVLLACLIYLPVVFAQAQDADQDQLRPFLKQSPIAPANSGAEDDPRGGIVSNPEMIEDANDEATDDQRQSDFSVDQASPSSDQVPSSAEDADSKLSDPSSDVPARLNTLDLLDVIASVNQSYPVIIKARQQAGLAQGQLTEAWGSFDTKLKLESFNEPTGFYENYRHSIGASRQNWSGSTVYGGYRIGRGSFQPWYTERETEEGGEFKLGYRQSLLQGREIDTSRVAVLQATLKRKAVAPGVRVEVLNTSLDAALQYWDWVEAGLVMEAQRSLVELAEKRGEQYKAGVKAGKFPEIDQILNKQLIAERRAKLIESSQKFQAAAFKLSLFLRDQQGNPLVPEPSLLPNDLPAVLQTEIPDLQAELANALANRPEVQLLAIERQRLQNEHALAVNQTEPVLDFIGEGSQDVGAEATSSDDKGEFVLILGLQGELPIQRRKARGKLISIHAKLAQLHQKQRFMQNKIQADLAIGFNELQRDAEVVEQASLSLEAARETLERYRFAFTKGKIDLIYLNLLEVKANETAIKYLNAKKQWHTAFARLRTSQGLDM